MNITLFHVLLITITIPICDLVQAQTCNTNITKTAPDYRFVDNDNGTVTDLWTGLMWKQCIEGMVRDSVNVCVQHTDPDTYSWQGALQRAVNVNTGLIGESLGWGDWRLPNEKELFSIIELSCADPAVNEKYFPLTFVPALATSVYWGSTGYAIAGISTWFVNFSSGVIVTNSATSLQGVRLVRTLP